MRHLMSACQSPLEIAFGMALLEQLGSGLELAPERGESGVIGRVPGWFFMVASQPNLDWCRPDFALVSIARSKFEDVGADANIVMLEVDGHDYHERTKEQARRDRSRDRRMVDNGWVPLRFTGQEVHEDATGCAAEAVKLFMDRQRRVLDEMFMRQLEAAARDKTKADREAFEMPGRERRAT